MARGSKIAVHAAAAAPAAAAATILIAVGTWPAWAQRVTSPSPSPSPVATLSPAPGTAGVSPAPRATPAPGFPGIPAAPVATPSPTPFTLESPTPLETPGIPGPASSPASPSNMVKVKADVIEYDRAKKIAIARGNADVKYNGAHITSEVLQFDQGRDTIRTDRSFVLTQPDPKGTQTIKGSGLAYNVKTKEATVSNALLNVPAPDTGRPVFVSGRELRANQKTNKFVLKDGIFSTCADIEHEHTPHYHVVSRSLDLVQDDYALGWDSWIYVNNRRFFWVPFFWVPLKKRETSVQFGQNDVEGFFAKTSWGYRLTPNHWGTLYTYYMQKKGPGLGVTHNWANLPASLSLFETYGLLQSDPNPGDLTGLTPAEEAQVKAQSAILDPLWKHGLDRNNRRPFDDYMWHVNHKQRLLDAMSVEVNAEDYNIYTMPNAQIAFGANVKSQNEVHLRTQDIRDDHAANSIILNDQRGEVTYNLKRDFRDDRNNRGMVNQISTNYGGSASWSREGSNVNLTGNFTSNQPKPATTPSPVPGTTASAVPVATPAPQRETTTTTANLTVGQTLPNIPGTQNSRADWTNSYSKHVVPDQPKRESLDEKLTFNTDLGWGDLRAELSKKFIFFPDPASRDVIIQSGHVDKLPELELKSKSILQELQPFTVAADMGRYFDAGNMPSKDPDDPDPTKRPDPIFELPKYGFISRFRPHVDLVNKAHDIGFLSTLDFGGTGFEQRFYSTGDQAYSTTLASALNTKYTEWLTQGLSYRRVSPGGVDEKVQSKRSNTPFRWDSLSLQKVTTLNVSENFSWKGNHTRFLGEALSLTGLPSRDWTDFPGTITWTHSTGYDYEKFRYFDYSTTLGFNPEPRISASINTSYHFKEVPYLDLTNELRPGDPPDTKGGRWNQTIFSLTLRSTAEAFGGVWGIDKIVPGIQFKTDLSWDPEKNKLGSLTNGLVASFGETWAEHWEVYANGSYDLVVNEDLAKGIKERREYHLNKVGISRDLHDFILSLDYDKQLDQFTVRLRMTALNFDILNFSNQSLGAGNFVPLPGALGGTNP
ncbi:MAG: hypothetical protein FJZ00_00790 [Candidatus Sericytochromatia bacterium]|uniref:LPS-assembly protein LptD n=1 Tax=Candidatus Tanganyikabacteria bacterium TaxID=2961651 RepID=A0A937X1Q3_9BACT|nr:hypothetical protein [Candidatus Tanganyikabacteria bacterium]